MRLFAFSDFKARKSKESHAFRLFLKISPFFLFLDFFWLALGLGGGLAQGSGPEASPRGLAQGPRPGASPIGSRPFH